MKNYTPILLLTLLTSCVSTEKYNNLRTTKVPVAALQKDIDFVEKNLYRMHPDVDWYISKSALHNKFDSLRNQITTPLTPIEFYFKISPVIAAVRQGHMNISYINPKVDKIEKKRLKGSEGPLSKLDYYWKGDKAYVLKNNSKDSNIILGSEIMNINGITPAEIYKKYRPTFSSDGFNETFFDKIFSKSLPRFYTYELGVKDSVTLVLHTKDSTYSKHLYRTFEKKSSSKEKKDKLKDSKKLKYNESPNDSLKSNIIISNHSVDSVNNKVENKDSIAVKKAQAKKLAKEKMLYGYNEKDKTFIKNLTFNKEDSTIAILKISSFVGGRITKAYEAIFDSLEKQQVKNLVLDLRGNLGGKLKDIHKLNGFLSSEKEYRTVEKVLVNKKFGTTYFAYKGQPIYLYPLIIPIALIDGTLTVLKTKKAENGKYYYQIGGSKPTPTPNHNFTGNIYVITDGATFSAASIIAADLQGSKRAIVVGEETGGAFNGTVAGRMPILKLRNSKLKWRIGIMSIRPVYQVKESGHGVMPNHQITTNLQELIEGKDQEMDWILKDIKSKK